MSLLNQTISIRDVQRQYKTVASAVKKSDKPIIVMNRSQAQLAFLELIRAQNKSVDFVKFFDEITTEVENVRQQNNYSPQK